MNASAERTWRIASLCISCPVHAGIMSFNVPNSSFILDRLRRSIRLCAVLRAVLRPAALVALGCFLFEVGVGLGVGSSEVLDGCLPLFLALRDLGADVFGFIWIILRARVGGGGKLKSSRGRFIDAPDRAA
jgi:hypothetical protein